MEPISSIAFQLLALTQLIAVGGPMHAQTLRLFANNLGGITKNTLLAAYTEATFVGYAPVAAIAWGTPYIDVNGVVRVDAPSADFIMTSSATPNDIYGWYLTDATVSTVAYGGASFPSPIPLTVVSQGLTVQPTFAWGD